MGEWVRDSEGRWVNSSRWLPCAGVFCIITMIIVRDIKNVDEGVDCQLSLPEPKGENPDDE